MTGFNLPPGCSVRDIPGNTAADETAEAMYDAIYEVLKANGIILGESGLSPVQEDALVNGIAKLIGSAYAVGYQAGMSDEAEATRLHMEAPKEDC